MVSLDIIAKVKKPLMTNQKMLGICIGCIIAKTNILVCVVGTNVPT